MLQPRTMIKAAYNDKAIVASILANSFNNNQSVNYIVIQDRRKVARLKALMEYSFDVCFLFGDVFLTDDKKGCALIVYPDKKKTTLKSLLLNAKLVLRCTGLYNVKKVMKREAAVSGVHPDGLIYYLWFIGVTDAEQGKGIGSQLLDFIVKEGRIQKRILCLETSTQRNIPWYQKKGFQIYKELDFGYRLYCMKME